MILYKNDPNASINHNILGFEYVIETETQFISITAVNDIVHSIEVDDKEFYNKAHEKETRMTLAECYEVVAFAKDIRAVVGQKIYIIESEVYPYSGNHVTIKT